MHWIKSLTAIKNNEYGDFEERNRPRTTDQKKFTMF